MLEDGNLVNWIPSKRVLNQYSSTVLEHVAGSEVLPGTHVVKPVSGHWQDEFEFEFKR